MNNEENGANASVRDKNGATALHYAVYINDFEMAYSILSFDPNSVNIPFKKTPPLHIAVRNNNEKMVRLLIVMGANLQAKDENDRIAHKIAEQMELSSICTLLEKHPDFSRNGHTLPAILTKVQRFAL